MSNEDVAAYWKAKRDAQAKAIDVHRFMVRSEAFPSCLNCDHWDEKGETCKKFKARPPAETIVFSCGQHWEPDIPF